MVGAAADFPAAAGLDQVAAERVRVGAALDQAAAMPAAAEEIEVHPSASQEDPDQRSNPIARMEAVLLPVVRAAATLVQIGPQLAIPVQDDRLWAIPVRGDLASVILLPGDPAWALQAPAYGREPQALALDLAPESARESPLAPELELALRLHVLAAFQEWALIVRLLRLIGARTCNPNSVSVIKSRTACKTAKACAKTT